MPGLEHVVSQSPAVGSPGLTVRTPPAALAGDVLEVGRDADAAERDYRNRERWLDEVYDEMNEEESW